MRAKLGLCESCDSQITWYWGRSWSHSLQHTESVLAWTITGRSASLLRNPLLRIHLLRNFYCEKLLLRMPLLRKPFTAKALYCENPLLRTALLRKCFTANIFSIIIFQTLINFVFLIPEYDNGKTFNNSYNWYKNPILFSDIIIILLNQSIEIEI